MTIEDQDAGGRCPACGEWLPASAADCPRCGTPRTVAIHGSARDPLSLRLGWLLGGGASLLLVGVFIGLLVANPDPASTAIASPSSGASGPSLSPTLKGSGTPSPRPRPTPAIGPSSAVSPSNEPAPTAQPTPADRGPLVLPAHYADVGSRGVVVTDRLRVRAFAGMERDILEELGAGTELLLREGPLAVDGLDWYEVLYPPCTGGCDAIDPAVGWVAVGPAGAEPTLVRVDPPRCPRDVPPTAGLLAAMGGLARTHCFGGGKLMLTAVIDTCQEGPLTPWTYEPTWMWFSCYSAFDLGSPGRLPLHFGPDSPDPAVLSRGSVVKVEGHMMDDAYRSCHIKEGSGGVVEDPAPVDQEYFVLHCLSSFVVTRLEVIGSVDLPTWPR